MNRAASILFTIAVALMHVGASAQRPAPERIKLPPGFEISIFASNLPDARSMAVVGNEWVFLSTRSAGRIYAIRHRDGRATQTYTLASNLNVPNGIAFRDGALYVAEINRILRFDRIEAQLANFPGKPASPVVVTDAFPRDGHHGWKYLRFGPDGLLYVPVGAPCNICEPDPDRYALISRIRADGSNYEVFARGVRNSVGFDWHPVTGELWFTDNGRDWLGDDLPSDELNHAPKVGMHFGYPYCHQGDHADPEFGRKRQCTAFTAPAVKLGAHVAGLGMRFYTGKQFPEEYRNNIFIAEHGSWNRSKPAGYRIKRVVVDGARVVKHEVFAEGWLDGDFVAGRPVDIEILPDGSLLVSDDLTGTIYRIHHKNR